MSKNGGQWCLWRILNSLKKLEIKGKSIPVNNETRKSGHVTPSSHECYICQSELISTTKLLRPTLWQGNTGNFSYAELRCRAFDGLLMAAPALFQMEGRT